MGVIVRVPATTANIGPGFDCLGIALSLYNTIEAHEIEKGLTIKVEGKTEEGVSVDENNLIYQSMNSIFKETGYTPKGIYIKQRSDIPASRGLGSSAACIIGGLLAGNELCGNPFTKEDILKFAIEIEGHPDNVAPALLGGFVVSKLHEGIPRYINTPIRKDLRFLVGIPNQGLSTKKSREVLPREVSYGDAVFNVGSTALLVATLMSGEYDKIGYAIADKLHQPYRLGLMDSMVKVFESANNSGVKEVFLSGAGPTIIALDWTLDEERVKLFKEILKSTNEEWELKVLNADNEGAVITSTNV